MRMHLGSSKDGRPPDRASETLPLSASPNGSVRVEFEVTRAGTIERRSVEVPSGSTLRVAIRSIGRAPEGTLILVGEQPTPLDSVARSDLCYRLVGAFSGG